MGSEKDSESPHSSVSGIPNPKCRAPGKRHGRISFHSLFHSKRGSRSANVGAATPLSQLHNQNHQQQQLTPLVPPVVPSTPTPNPAPTTTTDAPQDPANSPTSTQTEPLSSSRLSLGPPQSSSSTTTSASPPADFLECPLCLVPQPPEQLPELLGCSHRSCLCCLRQYLRIEITESRVHLSCPECSERLAPHQVADILDDVGLLEKYEEFLLRRCLASDPDCRWCPAPDCGFAVIASGCASCPRLVCCREGCLAEFCYHCKQAWHPNQTCDSARQQRALSLHMHSNHSPSYVQEHGHADDIKPCPRCGAYIIKMNDGSCNHMTCAVCGCEFCWLCMKEISDLHYLSPSGCTFWGKKPWTRKKKILWQLGTLIGAPVGITLIAGIAVPAMVIGIPVYAGRKIHAHYAGKKSNRHRRNLAITGGVALSIITAPVIAAVSVGIGVPIMLAYVYGVVPISLCRGGGCGVSRGKGRGMRIDFDEDDGPITVADAWRALKSPSLGESSLEGAASGLSTTSPSEGLSVAPGVLGDNPHFNTLAGGALGARTGKFNRLELQGGELGKDGAQRETGSLGAGSDCASTRGMAGSIISSYTLPDRDYTNLEIQVDIETKPSHLCLTSEEDLNTPPAAMAGEEPQDCSSRRGGGLFGSALGLSPGASLREGLRDVTLAQPESIRSDLEMSDTQSDDIAELTSDDCDSPHPKSCRPPQPQATCRPLHTSDRLRCPPDNVILYV
ncbi:E3 ubiquitin-protein ligase RNF19B [Salmo salar]|uniref:RBR-type E3 ubiquitin transferase n=1 Tax=Salmo salar TaxID=8030 RepID=A0A1S3M295_SALSA|nr:E3 ubiquitin-protein ligase RNF19B-like [Salmo salar]XP_013997347.1 E3 ubiquitin-protein ligase RNF19B-like [Salmo salar]XP_045550595.1 E3 ubiquitin-protein ligase RNF19B-like [Salmo salar]|eukprot:XP_013997346.1 PREDICTED: E3 ubiquitin-protein ligase RNF19B-like [Salmo salar]